MRALATFERDIPDVLAGRREVLVETLRLDGKRRRTRIWVVVVDDRVYIRSVRGERGHWYQSASESPTEVALIVDGQVIPVRVAHAVDADSIAACTRGLEQKYRSSRGSLMSMLEPHTLETTLLVEPR